MVKKVKNVQYVKDGNLAANFQKMQSRTVNLNVILTVSVKNVKENSNAWQDKIL